jgi:hypothetical protein
VTCIDIGWCDNCGAPLSAWERGKCGCKGPLGQVNREILYAIACAAATPLHARDYARNAERDFDAYIGLGTVMTVLATDGRFCWAGRGMYGLYRHGPLPGPRNLEQATRVLLVASGRSLNCELVDYCLKQLGYRFNVASLRNAASRSLHITADWYGEWDHRRGDQAELELRAEIAIVPPRQKAAWLTLRDALTSRINDDLVEREQRLQALADTHANFGISWED